jgi:alpha-galactosidase
MAMVGDFRSGNLALGRVDMSKLAVVGAGNVELTRKIFSDLFGCVELRGTLQVALHDTDPGRLATAEVLAHRLNAESGAQAAIDVTADRRRALAGAGHVICQIEVGGFDGTLRDFEIPGRYGVRQTIGDTIGVGGIFRGLRTAPVLIELARDMVELCPDAWLISYCDPMATLCQAVRELTGFGRMVGVCHSVRDTHALLADLVGRDLREITFRTAGVNHQSFVLTFEADGRSLYPDLDQAIEADPELDEHVRTQIYRTFGYFPTESSEHAAEYVPWFLGHDAEVSRLHIPIGDNLRRRGNHLEEYERMRRTLAAGEPVLARWKPLEVASEVIHSLVTGEPRRVYVTVPNDGLVDNLPPTACVEVPATVDSTGIAAQPVGALPPQLAALNRTFLNVVELTVAALVEGRRSAIYQAAALDPNTSATLPLGKIKELCDELIAAHAVHLPRALTQRAPILT